MAHSAQIIRIPSLDPQFVRDRNPDGNWIVERFSENISLLDKLAGNLPRSLAWRQRSVAEFNAERDRLLALDLPLAAYRLLWQDMLEQVQAFGLLSIWRLIELVSSAVHALRRQEPLCAAIMARAALETAASYAWFQVKIRPGINASIGQHENRIFVDTQPLEDELLKTLYASKLKDADAFYIPTNIVTIIDHITKKFPHQEDVGPTYYILCEVAHPNMLGRSIFISEKDGQTIISRERGSSVLLIEQASLLALSWAAATLPRSLTTMQDTCERTMKGLECFLDKDRS